MPWFVSKSPAAARTRTRSGPRTAPVREPVVGWVLVPLLVPILFLALIAAGPGAARPAAAQTPGSIAPTGARPALFWTSAGVGGDPVALSVRLSDDGDGLEVQLPPDVASSAGLRLASGLADPSGTVHRSEAWSTTPNGVLRVDLPAASTAGPHEVWIELTVGDRTLRTPPVALEGFRNAGEAGLGRRAWTRDGVSRAASTTTGSVGGGEEPRLVALPTQPEPSVGDLGFLVKFSDSPPRSLEDREVSTVVDSIRFRRQAASGELAEAAPIVELTIDEGDGDVLLGGATTGGSTPPRFTAIGLVGAGTEARIDLTRLGATTGEYVGDALVDLTRVVTMADGEQLVFGGIAATVEQRRVADLPPLPESSLPVTGIVLGIVGVLVLGLVLWSGYRQTMFAEVRHRRREDETFVR